MFKKESISAADQQIWAAAGVQADQTSDSTVSYEGAKKLSLIEGKGCLRSFENQGNTQWFAKFGIELNGASGASGASLKESGKQLFRNVYFVPTAEDLKVKASFTVRRGRTDTQEVDGLPMSPKNLLRRFPSLHHDVDGNVPFVAEKQTIDLKSIPVACVVAYTTDGTAFYRVVENYVVEA